MPTPWNGLPRETPRGSTGGSCSRQEEPRVSVVQPGCLQTSSTPSSGCAGEAAQLPGGFGRRRTEPSLVGRGVEESCLRRGAGGRGKGGPAVETASRAGPQNTPQRPPHALNL